MTAECQRAPQVRDRIDTPKAPRIDLGATSMERAAAAAIDRSAWDAAYATWQATNAAMNSAPADLPRVDDDALCEADFAAWIALINLPAPDWHASAWKVRQLLVTDVDGMGITWDGDIFAPVLADLDRLSGQEG